MASRFFFSAILLLATSIIRISEGREFLVGGSSNGWKVPSSPAESLNKWAEAARFHVGDSLGDQKGLYLSCNTSSPIAEHGDSHTAVELLRSGPYYFIGGARGACEKGEKLIVVVMAPRRYARIAPAPSPMLFDGPAVAPTSGGPSMMVVRWALLGALLVMGIVVAV